MPVVVEVLVIENCPHEDAAIRLIARTTQAIGVKPLVKLVEIPDLAQAARHGFVGSPTIRVNGSDVDPPAKDQPASLSCRHYATSHGLRGLPDSEQLRAALAAAQRTA
jgi:hypothetical protein